MRRLRAARRASAVALAALACGDSPNQTAPSGAPEPASAAVAAAPGDAAAGAATYRTYCATCHGADGSGDTAFARNLDPPPADHTDGARMNALTDDYLFRLIAEGGAAMGKSPAMAPWAGALSDRQIRDVIAYLRTLSVPPLEPATEP